MRRKGWISGLILSLLIATSASAPAQGKGQGKGGGQGKETGSQKAQGGRSKGQGAQRAAAKRDEPRGVAKKTESRGRSRPAAIVDEFGGEVERARVMRPAISAKHGQRIAHGAVMRGTSRGMSADAFVITPAANHVRILNRTGALLVDMDDDRDVGVWRVVTQPYRGKRGAPSFCRSGAGHPVWGRQWCVEKGFGLGDDGEFRWARGIDFNNVVFQRPITLTELLTREVLLGMVGDNAFNRLATHAISLGLVEPLTGRWMGEPEGPRVLLVSSGGWPVAELVDVNRDNRADMLVVATRP